MMVVQHYLFLIFGMCFEESPPFFFCYGFGSLPVVFSYGGKSSGKQNNSTCPGPQYKLQKKKW